MITEHSPEDKRCDLVMEPREESKHAEGSDGPAETGGFSGHSHSASLKPGQHTSNRARDKQKLDSHVGAVTEG